MNIRRHILQEITNGRIKESIQLILNSISNNNQGRLYRNIIQLAARFNRNEEMYRKGILNEGDYSLEFNRITDSLISYIQEVPEISSSSSLKEEFPFKSSKKVFISYSQIDINYAIKLKEEFEENGISVLIDVENLPPGKNIRSFIEDSIVVATDIILLVSKNSLLSSWVGIESLLAINADKISSKKFITAYVDNSFLDRKFVDTLLDRIDLDVLDLQKLISERLKKDRNINDLQLELERFQSLKHNLPLIISRIKEFYSVNIEGDNFSEGFRQILKSIT